MSEKDDKAAAPAAPKKGMGGALGIVLPALLAGGAAFEIGRAHV
jgi:hypothetical protein